MTKTLTEQKDVYIGDGYVGIEEKSYPADYTIQNIKSNGRQQLVSNSDELVQKIHILEKKLEESGKNGK